MPQTADTLRGLLLAAAQVENDAPAAAQLDTIVARGAFRPTEDETIGFWFARFLSVRENLRALIGDVLASLGRPTPSLHHGELRLFLVGYIALCALLRLDRVLLFQVGEHSIVQRKLNEAFPEYRIPRKQYTKIFSAFVDYRNVLSIRDAMKFATKHRDELLAFAEDPVVGDLAARLPEFEVSLNPSKRSYVRRSLAYISHKWRRRGVVSAANTLAGVMEGLGRTASEFCDMDNKQVTAAVVAAIRRSLAPGDVIVTRHARALTNLFLPGFWPHVAMYVGTAAERQALGLAPVAADGDDCAVDACFVEARKDGVRLRPLHDTLSVDMFVVLRPGLGVDDIRQSIERALSHVGKPYNFDFDFFNSDRLVCTEVVYRAYDGLGGLKLPLRERGGRKTLSAEDLLDYALADNAFRPVAIFGVGASAGEVVFGDAVRELLEQSYRPAG